MLLLVAGIFWGSFVTHNIEQSQYFKCNYDKQIQACKALEKLKEKK
jgi:hypothetical protein